MNRKYIPELTHLAEENHLSIDIKEAKSNDQYPYDYKVGFGFKSLKTTPLPKNIL